MSYACKVLADSISQSGHRLTSFEVTFPRIVLAELNTHCMLSRNSASSRARPVEKVVAGIRENPFIPESFGRNQKGMQPGEALEGDESEQAKTLWWNASVQASDYAERLAKIGVHKQYANRLVEPYSWHTAVITATDLDNFFHLRINPMAQREIALAAEMMFEEREKSSPRVLSSNQWHLPYISDQELWDWEVNQTYTEDQICAISIARCARVSYLTQNGVRDPLEDLVMYHEKLLKPGHMSPFEHVARPMDDFERHLTQSWDVAFDNGPMIRTQCPSEFIPSIGMKYGDRVITSFRGPMNYCGKLNGWISRRAYVRGEWDILGERGK